MVLVALPYFLHADRVLLTCSPLTTATFTLPVMGVFCETLVCFYGADSSNLFASNDVRVLAPAKDHRYLA